MLRSRWGRGTRYALVQRVGPALVLSGVVLALLLGAAPARGQDYGSVKFVGGLGYQYADPGPAIVASLDEAGWGDDRFVHGKGRVDNPIYYSEGLPLVAFLGARYRFPAPFSIEVLGSNGQRGHAEGYDSSTGQVLVARYGSLLLSATAGIHIGPLRLAAGPIMNASSWEITRAERETSRSAVLWGTEVVADGGIRISDTSISLRAGMRQFPSTDLGRTLNLPIRMEYHAFFVAVTVLTAGDY